MDDKSFIWTPELTEEMLNLRIEYDWLFKKKKQPWREFHKILLSKGFPKEMTIKRLSKKWTYTYDCYRMAKKTKNKNWKYYKLFDQHFCKSKTLDKYSSWSDEWRLKFIESIIQAKEQQIDSHSMWVFVERSMKLQGLPIDCCIQDFKGLWEHIKTIFNRKHRIILKKGTDPTGWPLYDSMLSYFKKCDPEYFFNLENESPNEFYRRVLSEKHRKRVAKNKDEKMDEFIWSRDITETLIQIKLQHEWLFRQRKQAWSDFRNILIQEYDFPEKLTTADIRRKWNSTFADYQKAVATGKTWVYFNLFKVYFSETKCLDPLSGWQEEWVFKLIKARSDMESLFRVHYRDLTLAWREVEKCLRKMNIPDDYILLDLPEVWTYLYKTFRWKNRFLNKGMLNESWPYYEAMSQYFQVQQSFHIWKNSSMDDDHSNDKTIDDETVDEDDLKLNELKEKLCLKPKMEVVETSSCRTCCGEEACVNIFEEANKQSIDLASKLRDIAGIKVEKTDNLPSRICFSCLTELENAYAFRTKCQESDKNLRGNTNVENKIKLEMNVEPYPFDSIIENIDDLTADNGDADDVGSDFGNRSGPDPTSGPKRATNGRRKVRVGKKKTKYNYYKICEVCGKHTSNLSGHLDTHASGKTYACDLCDKKFKFRSGLLLHRSGHDPTPKKTCEVCGKTFHILAQYRKHFVYHANERKYECDTCKKRFNTLDILRVHKRIHTDERPFRCEECGKNFRTAGCVSRHKRIVHRKAIKHQ